MPKDADFLRVCVPVFFKKFIMTIKEAFPEQICVYRMALEFDPINMK